MISYAIFGAMRRQGFLGRGAGPTVPVSRKVAFRRVVERHLCSFAGAAVAASRQPSARSRAKPARLAVLGPRPRPDARNLSGLAQCARLPLTTTVSSIDTCGRTTA
jgi:hypothetical protein